MSLEDIFKSELVILEKVIAEEDRKYHETLKYPGGTVKSDYFEWMTFLVHRRRYIFAVLEKLERR